VTGSAVRLVDEAGAARRFRRPVAAARSTWAPTVVLKSAQGVWELVGDLLPVLRADLDEVRGSATRTRVPAGCTVLGDPALLVVDDTATVEPLVVFDTRSGPIWLQAGAEVNAEAERSRELRRGEPAEAELQAPAKD
jgi:hypothetical protein